MQQVEIEEIEKSINSLPGILGCKVVKEEGEIVEVHILDSSNKNPKQIIRDIESTVIVDCDVKLDHKIISIAQINDQDVIEEDSSRLKILGFSKNMSEGKTEISVELINKNKTYSGKMKGMITAGNKLRYFSEAVLRAVEKFLGKTCNIVLNDIRVISIGRDKAVLISVTIINDHREEVFIGCSLIKGEAELSTIKATLNAINRRIAVLKN